MSCVCLMCFFFFKQKTAYEMRISDWSSDVCSSDLIVEAGYLRHSRARPDIPSFLRRLADPVRHEFEKILEAGGSTGSSSSAGAGIRSPARPMPASCNAGRPVPGAHRTPRDHPPRSEEHV